MSNIMNVKDTQTGRTEQIDFYNNTRTFTNDDGRVVTMDISPSDVHVDQALPNAAFGYKLAGGVADEVCPIVPVPKASDKYFIWDKYDAFQQATNPVIADGAQPSEISPRLSTSAYSTTPYALQAFVSTELEANADSPLRPRAMATQRLVNALLLAREARVAALLTTQGNYSAGYYAAATAQWNGGATSDPVADIEARMEAALMPITAVVMSRRVYHAFSRNSAVQKFIAFKDSVPGLPSPEQFTSNNALLQLPRIIVSDMKGLSNTTGTIDYVWGNNVALIHAPPGGIPADGQDVASAYTFRWQDGALIADGSALPGGFFVRSYFDQRRGGRGGTTIVVGHNDAEVMTSSLVSGLITGCYA